MYQCFVVRGEHVGPELAGRTVVVTTPTREETSPTTAPVAAAPTVAPFAAPITGARGCVPVPHIDEVLRRHFAGEPPDWAGIHPKVEQYAAAAHTMPEAELLSVAEQLEQTPACAALRWENDGKAAGAGGTESGARQFAPADWVWQVMARRRGDPAAADIPATFCPLRYAPAAAATPREATKLLARRAYPAAWLQPAASMADAVGADRLTDLGTAAA